MPTATINWTDDNYFKLISAVKKSGMSRSAFVNRAVERYLAELQEDQEDYEAAVAAWEEFEASEKKGKTLSEFKKELGL